jgi:hypothetical protein
MGSTLKEKQNSSDWNRCRVASTDILRVSGKISQRISALSGLGVAEKRGLEIASINPAKTSLNPKRKKETDALFIDLINLTPKFSLIIEAWLSFVHQRKPVCPIAHPGIPGKMSDCPVFHMFPSFETRKFRPARNSDQAELIVAACPRPLQRLVVDIHGWKTPLAKKVPSLRRTFNNLWPSRGSFYFSSQVIPLLLVHLPLAVNGNTGLVFRERRLLHKCLKPAFSMYRATEKMHPLNINLVPNQDFRVYATDSYPHAMATRRLSMQFRFLSFVLIFALCTSVDATGGFSREIRLSESANGKTITLLIGQTLSLHMQENPTTGFRWTVGAYLPGFLEQLKTITKSGLGKSGPECRANANFYTFVLAASLAWADLNLRTVKFRETRMRFFRVQNIPAAPSAQANHFRFAFALIGRVLKMQLGCKADSR